MNLRVYILPPLNLIFSRAMLNIVAFVASQAMLNIAMLNIVALLYVNVNSYQCSCKQCCPIAVYTMCYSLINPCGYWT